MSVPHIKLDARCQGLVADAVARHGSIKAVAAMVGYSRTALSLAMSGGYRANSLAPLEAKIVAVFATRITCPYLAQEMAAALIAASDRVRALSEQLAERPTMTVAAPAITPEPMSEPTPVMVRMLTDPGEAAARSVVAAWEAFQTARYSPRERFAVEHLHRSLSHLKAELSPAENQKDPCS